VAQSTVKSPETILVVDDAEMVLELVVGILESAEFNVLRANNGEDALNVALDYAGPIDLLLSDVQMPGMTGPDLGKALKESRPDICLMFMSGFGGDNVLVLNYGWAFIEKPFAPVKLLEIVGGVLHAPDRS
jgi:two-component system cell cycle sensor histidine kinase/response regulator CckA